jgi:putative ABC transport system permease protein
MKYIEVFKLAAAAIWAHKLRSALTLLGMVIGVAAVVVVASLLAGFNRFIDEKIAGIGTESFVIRRFDLESLRQTEAAAEARRRNKDLTLEDLAYLREHLGEVGAKAAPQSAEIKHDARVIGAPVSGTTANTAVIENLEVAQGRYFTDSEDEALSSVAYLGADTADRLFPLGTALGQTILIEGSPFRVIGVAVRRGTVFGVSQDSFINIPLKSYAKQFGPLIRQRGLSFVAAPEPGQMLDDAVAEARHFMRLRRHLDKTEKDDFGIVTPSAITGMRNRIFGPIMVAAVAVPSIALLVGGIVIMNMMLVSVTERTAEIGLRKAFGARRRDIIMQFVTEAFILSTAGGVVGVALAWLGGAALTLAFFKTYFSLNAVVAAVAVSGVVGLLSGILPALKAARLDPVEALRAEL